MGIELHVYTRLIFRSYVNMLKLRVKFGEKEKSKRYGRGLGVRVGS